MINLLLDVNKEFLLLLDVVLFEVFRDLFHLSNRIALSGKQEPFFLLNGLLGEVGSGVAELVSIYI